MSFKISSKYWRSCENEWDLELVVEPAHEGRDQVLQVSDFAQVMDACNEIVKNSGKTRIKDMSLEISDFYSPKGWFRVVDGAFLERFRRLKELVISDKVKVIQMTPKLEELLHHNDVLIRGSFDSFAEQFAQQNSLRFRPSNFICGIYTNFQLQHSIEAKLVFSRDGTMKLKITHDDTCDGRLSGSTYEVLPKDFYQKSFEDLMNELKSMGIIEGLLKALERNDALKQFLRKAKTHKFDIGDD